MKLYLLRHGESESVAASDAQRQLTATGRKEAMSVARLFRKRGIPLQRCIASPYVRAVQTAETFLAHLPSPPTLEFSDLLTPDKRAAEVMAYLQSLKADQVLLVSHNPLLSELNAMLVEGCIDNHSLVILDTCDLVAIDTDELIANGLARREFYLSPSAHCE